MSLDDARDHFCLRGLNPVFLPEHGWYRVDARGNKVGLNAQFAPPMERPAMISVASRNEDASGGLSCGNFFGCAAEFVEASPEASPIYHTADELQARRECAANVCLCDGFRTPAQH